MTKIVWGTYPISRVVTEGFLSRATVVWRFERGAAAQHLTASTFDRVTGRRLRRLTTSGVSPL
jgi:hypothetical protein